MLRALLTSDTVVWRWTHESLRARALLLARVPSLRTQGNDAFSTKGSVVRGYLKPNRREKEKLLEEETLFREFDD